MANEKVYIFDEENIRINVYEEAQSELQLINENPSIEIIKIYEPGGQGPRGVDGNSILPSGVISGSSQVIYSSIKGIPSSSLTGSGTDTQIGVYSGSTGYLSGSNNLIWSGSTLVVSGKAKFFNGGLDSFRIGYSATGLEVLTAAKNSKSAVIYIPNTIDGAWNNLVLQAKAGQSGKVLKWQNSSGVDIGEINASGSISTSGSITAVGLSITGSSNLSAQVISSTGYLGAYGSSIGIGDGHWLLARSSSTAGYSMKVTFPSADGLHFQANGNGPTVLRLNSNGGVYISGSVSSAGLTSTGGITCTTAGTFIQGFIFRGANNGSRIQERADGRWSFTNNAETDFDKIQLGGTTSASPAIAKTGSQIAIVLADASGYAAIQSLYQRFGSGDPNGSITAPVGAFYSRTDGGAGTSFYVKESGTGSSGWVAK